MARVTVSAGLALAFVSTGEAFAFIAPHALAQRRGATPQLRQATAAHVRPQQRGALHAQLRPEDEQMKSARPKFELGNAWQDFVGAAREGWATGADARATASLPNVFLAPVWIGVAAMGLFLPAPQLLESMFMGMNHGLVTPCVKCACLGICNSTSHTHASTVPVWSAGFRLSSPSSTAVNVYAHLCVSIRF